MYKFQAGEDDYRKRLDVFIADKVPALSRASVQKIVKDGRVQVNGQSEKLSYKIEYNDNVTVDYEIPDRQSIADIDLDILYEDDDCMVIYKPIGVLSHSKGVFNPESTVASFVLQHSDKVDGDRSGIVHRLDRATSGIMICGKTPDAMSWLQKQFSQRKVKKTYLAIIDKQIDPEHAIIDKPIERNPKKPQTFRTGNNGKSAQTEYEVIQTSGLYHLLRLTPKTGRTHQLRVHLADQKSPIVGDVLYGGSAAERLYLHASELELTLPNKTRKTFKVDTPRAFTDLLT